MKNLKLLAFIVFGAIAVTFTACDKATSLADVTFDATLSTTMDAASASETRAADFAFSGSSVIDPTSDDNIKKYWDNIKNWNIQKITLKVQTINPDANLTEGHLTVKDNDTQAVLYTADANALALTAGTTILEVTDGDWANIVSALNAQHSLLVAVDGAVDQPDVAITFGVVIDLKVTANPL